MKNMKFSRENVFSSLKSVNILKASIILIVIIDYTYLPILKSTKFYVDGAPAIKGNDWQDLRLSKSEKESLDLFKERVVDKLPESWMKTDFYLVKWLRAKRFNIPDAEKALFENIAWRKETKISTILSEDFSDVLEEFPITLDTHDKMDRPVGTINLGSWDLRAAVVQGKLHRLSRYVDMFQENLVQRILEAQQNGMLVTRAVVLIDLEGFNTFQSLCPSCISIYVKLLMGLESHFPGFMEEIILVNSSAIFRLVLDAVGGVMSQETRQVIKMFGTNRNEWISYLDERIERNQRNINFGGTKQLRELY